MFKNCLAITRCTQFISERCKQEFACVLRSSIKIIGLIFGCHSAGNYTLLYWTFYTSWCCPGHSSVCRGAGLSLPLAAARHKHSAARGEKQQQETPGIVSIQQQKAARFWNIL